MSQSPPQPGTLVRQLWPETLILWRWDPGGPSKGIPSYRVVGHWDGDVLGILLGYRADEDRVMDLVLYKGRQLWCDTDSLLEVSDGQG